MIKSEQFYSKKGLAWGLIGLLGLCGLMKASGGAGFLAIFFVLFAGFGKNRSPLLLFSLVATATLTMTNPFIAPKGWVFTVAARLVYLIAAGVLILQVVGRRAPKQLTPLLGLIPYLVYQALVSSVGFQPIISYLKLALFILVFLAFYGAAGAIHGKNADFERAIRTIFLTFACFFVLGSIALIPFPGIGRMGAAAAVAQGLEVSTVGLFMGVTLQPQALGPVVGVIATLLLADLLFVIRRWEPLYVLLLIASPVLVYYTSSRTAMGTWLAGMCFTSFVFMCANGVGAKWKGRALGALFMLGMLGGMMLFITPGVRDKAMSFILKTGEEKVNVEEFSFERFTSSRQGLMDSSMSNFAESPAIGNGFQVAKRMEDMEVRSWKQLMSAPIEKGVWITAVLEEGGIFGFIIFTLFLITVFPLLLSRHAYMGACALFVFVVANLGEFSFFSMSGVGGLIWAFVFLGLALDVQCIAKSARLRAFGYRVAFDPRLGFPQQSAPYPAQPLASRRFP